MPSLVNPVLVEQLKAKRDEEARSLGFRDAAHRYGITDEHGAPAKKRGRPAGRTGQQRSMYLDDETMRMAAELGKGSTGAGIRRAVKFAYYAVLLYKSDK